MEERGKIPNHQHGVSTRLVNRRPGDYASSSIMIRRKVRVPILLGITAIVTTLLSFNLSSYFLRLDCVFVWPFVFRLNDTLLFQVSLDTRAQHSHQAQFDMKKKTAGT